MALTFLAGGLFGLNRGYHGHAAGLRTTILVCLAASVVMLETNLLLDTTGKGPDSFVNIDVMRLPLGLLTGVGFIGGGVILHQGDRVLGITTAATLWFVTVLGLCFGAGQIVLGLTALVGGLAVVWGLGWAERHMHQVHHGSLALSGTTEGLQPVGVQDRLQRAGYTVVGEEVTFTEGGRSCERRLRLRWHGQYGEERRCPDFLAELAAVPGITRVEWKP